MDRLNSVLLESACRRWESQREAADRERLSTAAPRAFTITISREAGTPGGSVAAELGRLLGWPVYDQELLQQIAREMGLRAKLLESVDERRQTWLRETIQASLASLASGSAAWASESSFVHHLVETVLALGARRVCDRRSRGGVYFA